MSAGGPKKKRKKFPINVDMDLAFSQQKVDPRAGSELCVASLQGVCVCVCLFNHIYLHDYIISDNFATQGYFIIHCFSVTF